MGRKIITIARQTGSGGHEIGERLAEKLNIPFHDRNIIDKALEELNLDSEVAKDVDENLLGQFVDALYTGMHRVYGTNTPYYMAEYGGTINEQTRKIQTKYIKELAEHGPCVIVGRSADYVLRKRDDVLSVFICADEDDRIKRMMHVREMNKERASHTVKTTDENRKKYYEVYTEKKWGAPENYDLVLNVSRLGIEKVVEIIAGLYEG